MVCQKVAKTGGKRAPLVVRPILSEPFESIAFDLVGPLPKGRGGCRFILTYICLASRWLDALALTSVKAKAVARGMVELMCRTGIPLRLLTDQGPQFVGKLTRELCSLLQVDQVRTTAYHPESNGCIERMYFTLENILSKCRSVGIDWVDQLPLALAALRQCPCRSTGFSPAEIVYGRAMKGPLDLLAAGWRENTKNSWNVSESVRELAERIAAIREVMMETQRREMDVTKRGYDRGKLLRTFDKDDLVLERIPGLSGKLEEPWRGPLEVVEKLGEVTYRVRMVKGKRKSRVVHVNVLKRYLEKEECVNRLVVWMEDEDERIGRVELDPMLAENFCQEELDRVLMDFEMVDFRTLKLSQIPFICQRWMR